MRCMPFLFRLIRETSANVAGALVIGLLVFGFVFLLVVFLLVVFLVVGLGGGLVFLGFAGRTAAER